MILRSSFIQSGVIAISALAVLAAGAEARGTPKPKVNDVCQADFHKYCPSEQPGRGVVIRCARAHIDSVSADCKSAVDIANAANAAKRASKASRRASAGKTSRPAAASAEQGAGEE
jgi:hypothetical protein